MGGTTFLLTEERIALKNWRSGFLLRPGSNVFVSEYFKDLRCDFKNVTPNNITQVLVKHHKLPLFWTWASRLDTLLVRNSLKISKKRMFGLNSSFVHKHKTQPLNQRSVTFPHHSSLFWIKKNNLELLSVVARLPTPPSLLSPHVELQRLRPKTVFASFCTKFQVFFTHTIKHSGNTCFVLTRVSFLLYSLFYPRRRFLRFFSFCTYFSVFTLVFRFPFVFSLYLKLFHHHGVFIKSCFRVVFCSYSKYTRMTLYRFSLEIERERVEFKCLKYIRWIPTFVFAFSDEN